MEEAGNGQDIGVVRVDRQCPRYMVERAIILLGLERGLAERPMANSIHRVQRHRRFGAFQSPLSPVLHAFRLDDPQPDGIAERLVGMGPRIGRVDLDGAIAVFARLRKVGRIVG
jgi:hypothetical protein